MRILSEFFTRDVLDVAPELIGQKLIRRFSDSGISEFTITELEIYRGEEDLACHVSKGRTARTEIMYGSGGFLYMYLIYGMHWMLNIVTGEREQPQAILIRGINGFDGPGKLSKHLHLNKTFNAENLSLSKRMWIESDAVIHPYTEAPRIGIDYAGEPWKSVPWRYSLGE